MVDSSQITNEDIQIVMKIEQYCNMLDNKSVQTEDIQNMNRVLSDFSTFQNFHYLKMLLYQSSSQKAKFYAANSLINLVTQNYLTVTLEDKEGIYTSVLDYIQNNCEALFQQARYLLNTLISLLCRIIRISWMQSHKFKEIIIEAMRTYKEENPIGNVLPLLIYSELIYQFQLPDLPPKNKLFRYISDFKEYSLLSIYDFATGCLINIFNHMIKFENLEDYIFTIKEISKCLSECMEYEEDLNSKHENYKKFEIKPVYVPNGKKRTKDRTIDIETLKTICKSLFETHSVICRLIKDNNTHLERYDFCIELLQKYCSIKLFYLGDNKSRFLSTLQEGICDLIYLKHGLDSEKNLEEFCKLIFMLKKNFSVIELLETTNINFIEIIFNFTKDCINYFPYSTPGLIYLFRFFGYFSQIASTNPFPRKTELKIFLDQIIVNLMRKIFTYIESTEDMEDLNDSLGLFIDLVDSVALLSRGIFVEVNSSFNELFENCIENLQVNSSCKRNFYKLNYLIYFSTAVISLNQRLILEKNFVEKILDNEENFKMDVNDSMQSEDQNREGEVVSRILFQIFKILDLYLNGIKSISLQTSDISNLHILKSGIFYFLKNFSKLFLSRQLSSKYTNVFNYLSEILRQTDSSLILSFILNFLIEVCKFYSSSEIKSEHVTLQSIIKIFQTIVNQAYIIFDNNTGEKLMFVGKLQLKQEFFSSVMDLHNIVVKMDAISLGKYRKIFYSTICKILLLKENSNNNPIFDSLIEYYIQNIALRKDHLKDNNEVVLTLLGYIKDLLGISSCLNSKLDYKNFLTKIYPSLLILKDFHCYNCHVPEINVAFLKLIENLTLDIPDRISFPSHSSMPIQILNLVYEVMTNFKNYLLKLTLNDKDDYLKHVKPVIIIMRAFRNLFTYKYIPFGTLLSINPSYVVEILYNLSELVFSIKLENLLGYVSKVNVAYSIVKIIYCEYLGCFDLKKFSPFCPNLIKLVSEGLECLDNVSLIQTHKIIFEWGKLNFELNKNPTSLPFKTRHLPQENNENLKNFISYLFMTYEQEIQGFMKKILDNIFSGEVTLISEMGNSLFVLILNYETLYTNFLIQLINTKFKNPTTQEKAKLLSTNLFSDLRSSLDEENLEKFKKKLKLFSNELQSLQDS